MDSSSGSRTSVTLLGKLHEHPSDAAAWQRFVKRYGEVIYGWCRRLHLQDADAQDVTQEVLVKLAKSMRTFEYDRQRSFRGWLKTITVNAWRDYRKARSVPIAGAAMATT